MRDDVPASPAWAWSYSRKENEVAAGIPNIHPSILNPRRDGYRKVARHGTSASSEPPAEVERRPQGIECVACGHAGCEGHPK